MSENLVQTNGAAPSNEILQRLLERLYNSLVGGPSINCRPHTSRQRLDLTMFTRFADLAPAAILPTLLGTGKRAEIMAKTPGYRGPVGEDVELTDEERAAKMASDDQNRLLAKLRDIAEDARDYEQDHGESALYIGYPVLHLPPGGGVCGLRRGSGARSPRVLAPLALLPRRNGRASWAGYRFGDVQGARDRRGPASPEHGIARLGRTADREGRQRPVCR